MIFTLIILLVTILAVGCTGSNSEKNPSQTSQTPSQDQASSQQPNSPATYQDTEWIASVHKQNAILKADFDKLSNATNNYNISTMNNCDPNEITKCGQNLIDDAKNALDEDNKYSVSEKYLKDKGNWETILQICSSAGNSWIQVADDIKNGKDLNNTTNSSNLVGALGNTGAATYNLKRIDSSLG